MVEGDRRRASRLARYAFTAALGNPSTDWASPQRKKSSSAWLYALALGGGKRIKHQMLDPLNRSRTRSYDRALHDCHPRVR